MYKYLLSTACYSYEYNTPVVAQNQGKAKITGYHSRARGYSEISDSGRSETGTISL